MSAKFWITRTLLALSVTFAIISLAQYFKTKNLRYALVHAAVWSGVTTTMYLVALWRKLRKNKPCPAVMAADKR